MTDPVSRVIEDVERELLQIENRAETLNKEDASASIQIAEEEIAKNLQIVGSRIPKLESQRPSRGGLKSEYSPRFKAYKAVVDVHISDAAKSQEELVKCSTCLQKHLDNIRQIHESLQANQMKLEYASSVLDEQPEILLDVKRRLELLKSRIAEKISSTTELSKRITKLGDDAHSYKVKLQSLVLESNE